MEYEVWDDVAVNKTASESNYDFIDAVDVLRNLSKERREILMKRSVAGLKSSPKFLFQGQKYAFTHSFVWRSLIIPFLVFVAASLLVFLIVALVAYYPQLKYIQNHGRGREDDIIAQLYALYLVFVESQFLVTIAFMIFLDIVRRSIYDQLFEHEAPDLTTYTKLSSVPTKERLIIVLYSVGTTVALELLTAPLLTIPFGGKILVALAKGWALAWMYQAAFLASKGLSYWEQLNWVRRRFLAYELFGFLSALLLFIPVLSWVFYWTNLCGAALWALSMARVWDEEFKNEFAYLVEESEEIASADEKDAKTKSLMD